MSDPFAGGPQLETRVRALELQIEELRGRRRPRRVGAPRPVRRLLTALTLILAVGVLPMVVMASDTFSDVPDSNTFHDAINNLYDARIAGGCKTTPTLQYCPANPVTRGQMAAFLSRGLGRAASATGGPTASADTQDIDVASVNIETGGLTGGTGFVLVTGNVSAHTVTTTTCPCDVDIRVRDATGDVEGPRVHFDVSNVASPTNDRSAMGTVSWVFAVNSGTSYTFTVRTDIDMTGAVGTLQLEGAVSAIYVPFGATGGSTLGAGIGD